MECLPALRHHRSRSTGSAVVDMVVLLAGAAALSLAVAASARALLAAHASVAEGARVSAAASAVESMVDLPGCPSTLQVDAGPGEVGLCARTAPPEARGAGNSRVWRTTFTVWSGGAGPSSLAGVVSACRHVGGRRVFDMAVAGTGAPWRWVSAVVSWGGNPPSVMTRRIELLEWRSASSPIPLWSSPSGAPSGSTLQFYGSVIAVFSRAVLRMAFSRSFPASATVQFSVVLKPWSMAGQGYAMPAFCEVPL